jgi:hypothetical protein
MWRRAARERTIGEPGPPGADPPDEVVQIAFIRRLLGRQRPDASVEASVDDAPEKRVPVKHVPVERVPVESPPVDPKHRTPPGAAAVTCPNCGVALDPPPQRTRLCPRCRHRIVVRRADDRTIYLTEAAVEVFESERQREIDEQTWTRQRREWLDLARSAGAPLERRRRLAAATLSAPVVASSRALYLTAAERAVRAARRDKRWDDLARIRRRQAAALFEEAGGSAPPSDEIVALHQDAARATLRALAAVSRSAELVGASCCPACRADDERIFKIADELRTPRLPHPGCPRGLCPCDWWPALRVTTVKPRRRRAVSAPAIARADAVAEPAPPAAPGDDASGDQA